MDLFPRSATGDKGLGFPTDEHDNQGWKLYITSLVMILLAGVSVIARCCSRLWFSSFGWDDAAIVVSLVCEKSLKSPLSPTRNRMDSL